MNSTNPRRGLTLIELLVVVAIVGLLVALLLPAVQQARESARRSSCANNLKQQALGIHGYHMSVGRLPPSRIANHKATWMVLILPYIEQAQFFAEWDLKLCVYDVPVAIRSRLLSTYICPTRGIGRPLVEDEPDAEEHSHNAKPYPCAYGDYAAMAGTQWLSPPNLCDGAMVTGRLNDGRALTENQDAPKVLDKPWYSVTSFAHIRDGLSNTLLLGERSRGLAAFASIYNGDSNGGIYAGPANPMAVDLATLAMGSDHPGICQVAFCDGSTRPLRVEMSATVLGQLATRRGGEVVSREDY